MFEDHHVELDEIITISSRVSETVILSIYSRTPSQLWRYVQRITKGQNKIDMMTALTQIFVHTSLMDRNRSVLPIRPPCLRCSSPAR